MSLDYHIPPFLARLRYEIVAIDAHTQDIIVSQLDVLLNT